MSPLDQSIDKLKEVSDLLGEQSEQYHASGQSKSEEFLRASQFAEWALMLLKVVQSRQAEEQKEEPQVYPF